MFQLSSTVADKAMVFSRIRRVSTIDLHLISNLNTQTVRTMDRLILLLLVLVCNVLSSETQSIIHAAVGLATLFNDVGAVLKASIVQ